MTEDEILYVTKINFIHEYYLTKLNIETNYSIYYLLINVRTVGHHLRENATVWEFNSHSRRMDYFNPIFVVLATRQARRGVPSLNTPCFENRKAGLTLIVGNNLPVQIC